ncbi:hypothetical protein T492DRAFT_1082683 [Pavlovales sp. CCMP2436]|nr:hypothetical protein T492DRAFT_1082683 [Pavlovales sp. CCMP2436]|mmetsp:Transcript_36520/g.91088  ORF Transcript_36520/g.91088 Transcript_36520/m.91088 type:complete len:177 (+) Transcript_36520:94-624(+)
MTAVWAAGDGGCVHLSSVVVVDPGEVRRVLERAQSESAMHRWSVFGGDASLSRWDTTASLDPMPMSRARPLSDGGSPTFVVTPHEVRRFDSEILPSVAPAQPSRMLTLNEYEADQHGTEDGAASIEQTVIEQKRRRTELINRGGVVFAALVTLAAIVGGIGYWMHDSSPDRPGARN